MTKGRDIAAESLGNLLETARMQRRNGMLRVESSLRGYLEEGEIYLSAGQPIYARTERLVGVEALNYLSSWRNIHFSFVTDMPRPSVNVLTSFRQDSTTTPLRSHTQALTSDQLPITDGLRWNTREQPQPQKSSVPPPASIPGIEQMKPYKNGPERDILSLGLTRRQRVIYFLIDGQHTVNDLARTTSKTVPEVEVIINELRELRLINL